VAYRLSAPGRAVLRLYDLRGRALRTIVNPGAEQGLNHFDLDARGLPSGVYVYSIEAAGSREWNRCIIVR
jgi:hypothetical protein